MECTENNLTAISMAVERVREEESSIGSQIEVMGMASVSSFIGGQRIQWLGLVMSENEDERRRLEWCAETETNGKETFRKGLEKDGWI